VIETKQQRAGLRSACHARVAVAVLFAGLVELCGCEKVGSDRYPGYAQLRWTAVTADTEGKPLPALAGYRIFYGRASASLDHVVDVPGQDASGYLLTNLAPGAWYFAVAACITPGSPGMRSNIVQKNVH
jgi:hypothetical protein